MGEQKHRRRIMMDRQELDAFLAEERVCRVATVSADGAPHATPLWFWWDAAEGRLWLYSLTRSKRWSDLARDARVAVVIDSGHDYAELRGAELSGEAAPAEPPAEIAQGFAAKYFGLPDLPPDNRHAWLRVTPTTTRSWDFRKLTTPTPHT